MKQIVVKAEINQLLQPIPASSEQFIRGGALNETVTTNTDESAEAPTIAIHGYVKIKKLNSGG